MIRVRHGLARRLPRLVPADAELINQQSHQLCHGNRRMGIVQLDAVLGGKLTDIVAVVVAVITQHVLQAGRCKKVLLAQPEFLAVFRSCIRVQHHGDVLRFVLRCDRARIAAGVEFLEVELVGRRRRPEAQRIHDVIAIARYRHIEGDRKHVVRIDPGKMFFTIGAGANTRPPTESDRLGKFESFHFPRKTFAQPGIGLFNLVAVFEALVKHPVLVADAVADDGQL